MAQPTKTTSKNAILGFCSLIMIAKNVEIRAIPTICRISMTISPFTLEIERPI